MLKTKFLLFFITFHVLRNGLSQQKWQVHCRMRMGPSEHKYFLINDYWPKTWYNNVMLYDFEIQYFIHIKPEGHRPMWQHLHKHVADILTTIHVQIYRSNYEKSIQNINDNHMRRYLIFKMKFKLLMRIGNWTWLCRVNNVCK